MIAEDIVAVERLLSPPPQRQAVTNPRLTYTCERSSSAPFGASLGRDLRGWSAGVPVAVVTAAG